MAAGAQVEQRRSTVPGRLLTLRPRTRPPHKTFTKCQQAWRWTRSVGVLVLVGVVLAVAVLYSDEVEESASPFKYQPQEDDDTVEHLEKRSTHMRRELNKRQSALWHHHDGIAAIRKSHGSLRKSTNVLLITYPDLTLSILPDILTLGLKSAYFLEPLLGLMFQPRNRVQEDSMQQDMLYGLFSCRWDTLRKMAATHSGRIIRKLGGDNGNNSGARIRRETDRMLVNKCLKTTLRLTETTRTRLRTILPLFDNAALDLKVVHLVSDPRSNIEKLKQGFPQSRYAARYNVYHDDDDDDGGGGGGSPQDFCSQTVKDLDAAATLKRSQYFRIRYEDFVSDPVVVARRLHAFLDMEWLPTTKEFLRKQINKRKKADSSNSPSYNRRTNSLFFKTADKDCRKLVKIFGTKQKL